MKLHLFALAACTCGLLSCTESEPGGRRAVDDGAAPLEVRICVRADPEGLNPILSVQSISRFIFEQIFQTLNAQDPETLELVPLLASVPVIEMEEDGTTSYHYTLDSAATWPNGSPILAPDVIFSMKVLMNPYVKAGPYRLYYEMVDEVVAEVNDPRSFRVTTKRPYILADQAMADLYIYPAYAYDPRGLLDDVPLRQLTQSKNDGYVKWDTALREFARAFNNPALATDPDKITGSGPYQVVEWEDGQLLRLSRRPNYWAQDRKQETLAAIPDYLTFVIIPEAATAVNALRDRALDVMLDMPVDQFLQLRDDPYLSQYYEFVAVPGFRYYAILLNQEDPLLRDSLTRRALARTVNVEQIIDRLLPGLARRIVGPVLPTKPYYNQSLSDIPYDLEGARQLLREAGWTDSNGDGILDQIIDGERRDLRFRMLSFPNPTSEAVTLVVAEGARKVGIEVEVVKQEARALISTLDAGDFTASFYGLGFEPTPDDFAQGWLSTSVPPAGTNRGNFENVEADRLIRQIAVTTDSAARNRMYRRFQEIIYANQPMIFLYSPFDRLVISKRYRYTLSSVAPNVHFSALSLKEQL